MKCNKKGCPGKAKCSKCSHGKKKPVKPTVSAKSKTMRLKSSYKKGR